MNGVIKKVNVFLFFRQKSTFPIYIIIFGGVNGIKYFNNS